jgi:hypothetical protein
VSSPKKEVAEVAIENRMLAAGTRLVGRYKKQDHFAEVVQAEDGGVRYRLGDGREFKSLSAAGSAVMGGVACNGWRFWSLVKGEETETSTAEEELREVRRALDESEDAGG